MNKKDRVNSGNERIKYVKSKEFKTNFDNRENDGFGLHHAFIAFLLNCAKIDGVEL